MTKPPELLREELEKEEVLEIDLELLESIRRSFSNIESLRRIEPGVAEVLEGLALSMVKARLVKAIEGRVCRECFDKELLEIVRNIGLLFKGIISGDIPLTPNLKLPVRALKSMNFKEFKKYVNLPSKIVEGEIFYVDLHLYPFLKHLNICEVIL